MALYDWPHPHLGHALCDDLANATAAGTRNYTSEPRSRTFPYNVVKGAGVQPLGTTIIQADEPRVQVDSWGRTREEAEKLAAQVFRLWDKRFGGLQDRDITVEDEGNPGDFYRVKIERILRTGGGDAYFDELAGYWRVTSFYGVKVNL